MIITARKDISIFIKLNTYGVVFTLAIISYIIGQGIYALSVGKFEFGDHLQIPETPSDDSIATIGLFSAGYAHLMGILGGGFYLHNMSLPIYRNSKKPEHNYRDIFLGFCVVCLSYIFCGVFGYIGFSCKHLWGDTPIADNFLNMYDPKSVFACILRVCCFFQITGTMSLIFACQRSQILLLLTG